MLNSPETLTTMGACKEKLNYSEEILFRKSLGLDLEISIDLRIHLKFFNLWKIRFGLSEVLALIGS